VKSYCYESPKPTEFGAAGANWHTIGWKVEVVFAEMMNRVRPKDFIRLLVPHLAAKYAPLRPNGDGLQSVYLTEVSAEFAGVIFQRISSEVDTVLQTAAALRDAESGSPAPELTLEEWERRGEERIAKDGNITDTSRLALIQARRGQGIFRKNVREVESACRVTGVDRLEHLVASHIQPWGDSSHDERLDGENGLLLTPTVDHLFDKGFISFEDKGAMIISPVADPVSLGRMGIDTDAPPNVGVFSGGQRQFLDYHRDNVLRMTYR